MYVLIKQNIVLRLVLMNTERLMQKHHNSKSVINVFQFA